ncbi:hypothetical protein LIER_08933 [Lithospermum erythrorhizon]|uniref:Uncharacterized protein n=1 Tax=Lithospermum erythrorhizon TaxID=34254 RepID=A0AAV3PFU7_LITER
MKKLYPLVVTLRSVPDMDARLCSSFQAFNTKSLVRLAILYPNDFQDVTNKELSGQLENYIQSVKMDDNFFKLKGILDLSKTLVRTKKAQDF